MRYIYIYIYKFISPVILEMTDNLLAAQSFVFFVAGFETTSSTLHFTLYLLAKHPEAQERARKEIHAIKNKYGNFTYDSLKEMSFLDNCISGNNFV